MEGHLPSHLKDCEVDLPPSVVQLSSTPPTCNSVIYPLSNHVSYNKFSHSHSTDLATISAQDEPKNFFQAIKHDHWKEVMKNNIEAHENNGTWMLELPPLGKNAIGSRWVYKLKHKPNGEVECYKARLIARGFTQIEEEDFHETLLLVSHSCS